MQIKNNKKSLMGLSSLYLLVKIQRLNIQYSNGKYYINYTIVSEDSYATALGVTEDFKSIKGIPVCQTGNSDLNTGIER